MDGAKKNTIPTTKINTKFRMTSLLYLRAKVIIICHQLFYLHLANFLKPQQVLAQRFRNH